MYGNLASLEGRLRHCVRYKTAKGGRKRCAKFGAGSGSPRGRKKAGILSRFYERSTTKKRAKRICTKRGVRKSVRRCLKWRSVSAALFRKRSLRRRKGSCLRFGRNKLGRKVCRKFSPGLHRRKSSGRKKTRRYGTAVLQRRATRKLAASGYGKGYVGTHDLFGLEAPRRRKRRKSTSKRRRVTSKRRSRRR